jgi:hypothetical protein
MSSMVPTKVPYVGEKGSVYLVRYTLGEELGGDGLEGDVISYNAHQFSDGRGRLASSS